MSKPDVKFLAIVAVILLMCAAVPLMLVPKKKEGFLSEQEQAGMWVGIGFFAVIVILLALYRISQL